MIKPLILVVLTLSTLSCSTTKSKQAFNYPGTKVFLTLEDNFYYSDSTGAILHKNKDCYISCVDMRGGNFHTQQKTFTKNDLINKGQEVMFFEEGSIDGFNSKKAHMKDSKTETFTLIFGDTTFSCMLLAQSALEEELLMKEIKEIILSVDYRKSFKIDYLAKALFNINTDKSIYKLKDDGANANLFIYSKNGDKLDSNSNSIIIMQTIEPNNLSTPKWIANNFIFKLDKFLFEDYKYESENKINGYDAYEAILKTDSNDKNETTYIMVLKKDNIAITYVESVKDNSEIELKEMQKIAQTIKFK